MKQHSQHRQEQQPQQQTTMQQLLRVSFTMDNNMMWQQ